MAMSAGKDLAKLLGATGAAVSLMGGAAFAKGGAAPKQGFFGVFDNSASSPYASGEDREDPLYSPYSPYGNGEAAVYKEGQSEEIKFWTNQLNNCIKRTENIPKYTSKKQWENVRTELTSYSYNLREAMLRLAATSKDKAAATQAAKTYFVDINDIFVSTKAKDQGKVDQIYQKSLTDLKAFKALL